MKQPNKTVIVLISVPVLILIFFSSNIYGYFRFKTYCSSEGGLHVYEKLEKNVGWLAKDEHEAKMASRISNVSFARYKNILDGQDRDVRYVGGDFQDDKSYKINVSDKGVEVLYRWDVSVSFVDESKRLKKGSYDIFNASSNQRLASYFVFYYSPYGGNLGGPDWQVCENKPATDENLISALSSIFRN